MLADVERVDPDPLREDTLLDRVANHLIAADRLTIKSGGDRHERVKAEFRGCAFTAAAAEAPAGGRVDQAAESYRGDIRALFTELAAAAGAPDPQLLASQLQLIYDGGGLAANMDRDPTIAAPARAAAAAIIAAAITSRSE